MASIYDLKPRFQALLRPICGALYRSGVTANQVTILAVLLSAAGGAWLSMAPGASAPLIALPIILFLRMALNAIDGMLAREHDMTSKLGAILNEMGDVISDSVLFLPLALHPAFPAMGIVCVVLLGVISEMMGVVSIQIGADRRYDGPFGKSDRALVFGLLGLLTGLDWIDNSTILFWATIAMIAAAALTIVNRARQALKAAA